MNNNQRYVESNINDKKYKKVNEPNQFEPDNKNVINAISLLLNNLTVRDMTIVRDIIDKKIDQFGRGNRYAYNERNNEEDF